MKFERSNSRKENRRVSVYDVARHAGVSHQSVSNVLNNPNRVSPKMSGKVQASIKELGYEASATARALDSGRTNILGLEVPRFRALESGGFFEHFTLSLVDAAQAHDQQVLVFAGDADGVEEHKRLYRAGLIDGIIIADTKKHDRRIEELSASQVPFVAFGRTISSVDYSWVDVNNRSGIRQCVERLVSFGHERIAFLDSAHDTFYGVERMAGFKEALQTAKLSWFSHLTLEAENDHESAERFVLSILQSKLPPSAIITGSDLLAVRVIEVTRKLGLPVGPERFAVITFDDTVLASAMNPAITAVHQPILDIAFAAIEILNDRVAGKPVANRLIEPSLVIRASG